MSLHLLGKHLKFPLRRWEGGKVCFNTWIVCCLLVVKKTKTTKAKTVDLRPLKTKTKTPKHENEDPQNTKTKTPKNEKEDPKKQKLRPQNEKVKAPQLLQITKETWPLIFLARNRMLNYREQRSQIWSLHVRSLSFIHTLYLALFNLLFSPQWPQA